MDDGHNSRLKKSKKSLRRTANRRQTRVLTDVAETSALPQRKVANTSQCRRPLQAVAGVPTADSATTKCRLDIDDATASENTSTQASPSVPGASDLHSSRSEVVVQPSTVASHVDERWASLSRSNPPNAGWTCGACTLFNLKGDALACEACGTLRHSVRALLACALSPLPAVPRFDSARLLVRTRD